MSFKKKFQLSLPYLMIFLCMTGVVLLQKNHYNQITGLQIKVDYFREERELKRTVSIQKNLPSLGFNNLIADWIFLKYIQYYGDSSAREQTGYSLITDYFETMLKRDPRFILAYLNLSTANSMYAGRPEKTVVFMEEVLKHISPDISPLAHFVWIYKGVDELLFLGDIKAAQKSYEMAAKWVSARKETTSNEVADRLRRTARFIANNPRSKQARIGAWMTILNNVSDRKTQEKIIGEIKELGGKVEIKDGRQVEIELPKED